MTHLQQTVFSTNTGSAFNVWNQNHIIARNGPTYPTRQEYTSSKSPAFSIYSSRPRKIRSNKLENFGGYLIIFIILLLTFNFELFYFSSFLPVSSRSFRGYASGRNIMQGLCPGHSCAFSDHPGAKPQGDLQCIQLSSIKSAGPICTTIFTI